MDETTKISLSEINKYETQQILSEVYYALKEKGYNPVTQLVGYIVSNDPTYITSHKGARGIISRLERDELLEALVGAYIENVIEKPDGAPATGTSEA
ncbi:MAG: IreB family regulatory phosphoprotein [Clostridiales bacterium]|nr:IreB family regulatory phosphoprotein [Clostridiales bacterium]